MHAASTQTLGQLLARRAAHSGDAPAIRSWDGEVDYRALDRRADDIAASLREAGIRHGDRVGLLLQNGLGFTEAFFGIVRASAVACPLNARLSVAELGAICRDSGKRLLIYDSEFAALATELKASVAGLECLPIDDLRHPAGPMKVEAEASCDDVALLIYTSGTTGRPKGVVFTHDQLVWASLTMVPTLDMRPGDVHLLPVPMFHVGGLSFVVHCVHLGITLTILPRWDASAVLACIEQEKVAHFFAVPTMLSDLVSAEGFAPDRLKSVRWIMGGGAPVPTGLIQRYHEMGIPLLQTCGATETGGPGLVVDRANALKKAGSVGRGFFHTDIRLVDETGAVSRQNQPGEIQIRARHVASGYWNAPDMTAEAFSSDGWYRTGDIGVADDDGYISIVDRKRNKIISGGENIYPAEVEAVLSILPGVADVAVVGLPDARWGEIVTAVVVKKAGHPAPTLEDLRGVCEGAIARYKHPRRLLMHDALPRNATGKLLRERLFETLSEKGELA